MSERRPSYDPLLLFAVLTLVGFGLVMGYGQEAALLLVAAHAAPIETTH